MGVIFKGGTSGNREDAKPPVPSSGSPQPMIDSSTSGAIPSTIHLQADNSRSQRHGQHRTADFMPTGVNFPESGTDIADPTATKGGDASVFKGTDD